MQPVDAGLGETTILAGIADALVILDARWRVAYRNPAAATLFEVRHGAPAGADGEGSLPDDLGAAIRERCGGLGDAESTTFERYVPSLDRWLEIRASRLPAGLVVLCRDITAPKAREAEALARARRDRLLVDQAADGLLIADGLSQILDVNARLCAMLGYPREALLWRNFVDLIDPDDLAARPLRREELLAGRVLLAERRWRRGDGGVLHAETNSRMLDDGRVQIIVRDIGERKAAAAALAASEARLRLHYEHCPLPTLTWRWDGDDFVLIDANAAQRAMAGGQVATSLGRPMREIHRDRPDLRADHARCLAERSTFRREFAYRQHATGEERQLAATYVFVPPDLVVAYAEDLTARKAEEALQRDLRAAAERQARDLRLLDRVRTALARELDPAAVCRVVVEAIAQTFGYTQVSLYLREGGEHVLQHQVGYERVLARIPVAAGVSGRAVALGRPLLIEDAAADPAFLGAIDGVTSEICVPLQDAGHPAGFLNVERTGGVRLGEEDLRLMAELGGQVGIALERARLHDALREREEHLAHQASHDALTGLPNRALFLDRLDRALIRGRRCGATCAVLFLDLDRFKQVNDSLGHGAGDELLVAVAVRLRTALREADTLARFGGDEFAVLLEDIGDLVGALRAAERLLAALAAPLAIAGRSLVVTTSIGLALSTTPEDTPADLLRFADVALYRAKDAGRSCCEVFYPGMNRAALARLELERDLHGAAERGEVLVHYQPLVDLATGRVAGLEALARWHHPARGPIPPGEFIPLAEETGLIVPLGRWVLREACRQLVAWRRAYPRAAAPVVAVNLSPRQFRHPDLVGDVAAALAETGLPPRLLRLELTETVAMTRPAETTAALEALRALGVSLALDDFGTGYSSLAYLQELPVDALKIDRSFFAGGARNRAIIRAVAELGRALGLEVVAEGLETAEQVAWARSVGFDLGQGFRFAPPLAPARAEAFWARGLAFDLPADGPTPTHPTAGARAATLVE